MIEIAIYALFGLAGALSGYVLIDGWFKLLDARVAVRKQLEDIRNN